MLPRVWRVGEMSKGRDCNEERQRWRVMNCSSKRRIFPLSILERRCWTWQEFQLRDQKIANKDFLRILWRHNTDRRNINLYNKGLLVSVCNPKASQFHAGKHRWPHLERYQTRSTGGQRIATKALMQTCSGQTNSNLGQKKPHCNSSIVLVRASLA